MHLDERSNLRIVEHVQRSTIRKHTDFRRLIFVRSFFVHGSCEPLLRRRFLPTNRLRRFCGRGHGPPRQQLFQIPPGVALLHLGHVLGRAFGDDAAAAVAAFGAEVQDPVGGLDHFQIVLDDDDGVACIRQFVQHLQQFRDVVEMQARGRFIQNVERASGGAARSTLSTA